MLARFFKPKWQHRNAEIRLRAVSKLSAQDPSSSEILNRLALEDQDAEVRRAALERLEQTNLLLRASREDNDSRNRTVALQRITRLISGEQGQLPLEQRLALLPQIDTNDLLIHLALRSDDPQIRQQAGLQLDDEQDLLQLILQSNDMELRHRTAERLRGAEPLERLEKEARNKDKRLFRIARDKLQQLREQARQAESRRQRRRELLESMQHLVNSEDFPLFGAKHEGLKLEWSRCNEDASPDEQQQWQQLDQQAAQRQQAIKAAEQAAAEAKAAAQARQQQLSQFEQQLDPLAHASDPLTEQQLEALRQQWQQLQESASPQQRQAIDSQLAQLANLQQAQQRLADQQDALQTMLDEWQPTGKDATAAHLKRGLQQIDKRLKKLDWPQSLEQPATLKALHKLHHQLKQQLDGLKQQQQSCEAEQDQQLDELAQLIGAGEARKADRLHNRIQQQRELLTPAQAQRFKGLHAELQELRDWQGYALTPKREALCQQMEALVDSELPPEQLAQEIRQLQQQWRELDSSGSVHSRTLWNRFKAASDRAYQPCDAYYAEQRELRQQNLVKRQAMVEQLDNYTEQLDWQQPDWKAVEEITRTAKAEWRRYSPVDRGPGKELQRQFNKLINQLEGKLKAHRKAVQEIKEGLLARAAELLEAEDLAAATDEAKSLQQQWKEAGTTFRTEERRLWSEFRGHCNALFEKRHQSQQAQREQRRGDRTKLEQLCQQLEQLRQQRNAPLQLEQSLNQCDLEYQQLCDHENSLNPSQQKHYQQLSALLHAQLDQLKSLMGDQYLALQRSAVLCQQLEEALLDGDAGEHLAEVQQAWQQGPALPKPYAAAMQQRFQLLCQLAEDPTPLAEEVNSREADMRQLCIRLEILLGEPSPEQDQALRLEYQMQRLQQALVQQQEGYEMADIKRLEYERLCVPFASYHEALNERFDRLLAKAF
ncbi:DUF349 domain-containing protein [Marinobacterium arenosum]|uniref:DUF349 domain-containing protein n=1 Tax=Marinobacterium arenosum TaxID=2862496 RepID=UPI001C96D3C9|nr:DUF349 domain-containing protein [Marinobacterium arenosum]MBY4677963.1 DUF349 domain-containing protein [Marinobacterium arenosum]